MGHSEASPKDSDMILHFDNIVLCSDLYQNALEFSKLDSHLFSQAVNGYVPVVVRFAANWSHNA